MDPQNPNSSNQVVPRKYKFVFLGDQSVGKTSIITRYCNDKYDADSDVIPNNSKLNNTANNWC